MKILNELRKSLDPEVKRMIRPGRIRIMVEVEYDRLDRFRKSRSWKDNSKRDVQFK